MSLSVSAMRKIREILRLALGEGLSRRTTAAATGLPYTTVSDPLGRAAKAGLGWPLPDGLDDDQLEARLFARAEPPPSASRPLPDWPLVHRELRRKGVTLQLLHMEYKEREPSGYQYTRFCRHYRAWARHLDLVMRQEHRAGEMNRTVVRSPHAARIIAMASPRARRRARGRLERIGSDA
jgi:transposase